MAGILANTVSVTMTSGTVDGVQSGYITNEQVTLSADPSGSSYAWGAAKPGGSTSRAALSSSASATPVFTPDVAGTYTITCDVDGTVYVLRITVTAVAITSVANAHRMSPVTDNSVPTPAKGQTLFASSDFGGGLSARDEDGALHRVGWKRRGSDLGDADATVLLADGELRVMPASTMTAGRTVTLGATGARNGSEVTVRRRDTSAFTLVINNGGTGGGTLATLPIGQQWWARARFDGADWELIEAGTFP
jgi:hypothetical protein